MFCKKVSKKLPVVLSLLFIISMLLSACSPAATPIPAVEPAQVEATKPAEPTKVNEPNPTAVPTAAPTATTQPAEPVTLNLSDWYKDQSPAMDQAIAEFEASHPNIKIKREIMSAEPGTTLNLAFESGNLPDVFLVPTDNMVPLNTQVERGWLMPLNDLPGFQDLVATYPMPDSVIVEGNNTFDGQTYTLPIDVQRPWVVMFVNTGLYKEAGLNVPEDLPKTWDQVIANSKTIKEKTGRPGYHPGAKDTWFAGLPFWACNFTNGVGFVMQGYGFDPRLGKYDAANNQCVKDVIQMAVTMRDEKLLPADYLSVGAEQAQNEFPTEKGAAHILTGSWVISGWRKDFADFKDYTAIPLPVFNQTGERGGFFYYSPGGRFLGISSTTKHANEAFEFLKFMYGPAFGKAWAATGNGTNLFTPKPWDQYAQTPAEISILNMDMLSIPGPDANLRNPEMTKVQASAQGDDLNGILIGYYAGVLKDTDFILNDYDERFNAGLEQAVADAVAAGAKVSMDDYKFPDWDPTKPYTK